MVKSQVVKSASAIASKHGIKTFYKQVLYRMADRKQINAFRHESTGELLFDERQVINTFCSLLRSRIKKRYGVDFKISFAWQEPGAEITLERPLLAEIEWDTHSLTETEFLRQKLEPAIIRARLWNPERKICPECGSHAKFQFKPDPEHPGSFVGFWRCIKQGCQTEIYRNLDDIRKFPKLDRKICNGCNAKRKIKYIVNLKGKSRSVGREWLICKLCGKKFLGYTEDEPLIAVKN